MLRSAAAAPMPVATVSCLASRATAPASACSRSSVRRALRGSAWARRRRMRVVRWRRGQMPGPGPMPWRSGRGPQDGVRCACGGSGTGWKVYARCKEARPPASSWSWEHLAGYVMWCGWDASGESFGLHSCWWQWRWHPRASFFPLGTSSWSSVPAARGSLGENPIQFSRRAIAAPLESSPPWRRRLLRPNSAVALLVKTVQGRPLSVAVQRGMVQVGELHGVAKLVCWRSQLWWQPGIVARCWCGCWQRTAVAGVAWQPSVRARDSVGRRRLRHRHRVTT
jgi:hypothetical protein